MNLVRVCVFVTTGALSALVVTVARSPQEPRTKNQEHPSFVTRAFSGVDSTWARANGLTTPLNFSHNLGQVFPPELYSTHPEFFPLEGSQRIKPPPNSYFWNPDVARADVALYAARAARQHFDAHPADVSFALGVNDALVWGESPELLSLLRGDGVGVVRATAAGATERQPSAVRQQPQPPSLPPVALTSDALANDSPNLWFRERPNYSDVVFTFMNRAAVELEKTYPNKYLGALAYYWAENVPTFGVHPQVVPFLTADRSQGYDPAFKSEEFDLQERWGVVTGWSDNQMAGGSAKSITKIADHPLIRLSDHPARRLGMYDYLYGAGFLIPRIWTKLLDENLKHAHRSGFTDYYAEAYPNEGLDGPMLWLTARLLRNVDASREELLEEFYRTQYRDAAEPMRRFFERCETLWMKQPGPGYWLKHYRNESQAVIFPASDCRALRGILDEATERVSRIGMVRASDGRRVGESRSADHLTIRLSDHPVSGVGESSATRVQFEAPGTAAIRRNVRLVSDAFGVTERFVTFCEARDVLSRLALGASPRAEAVELALGKYLAARDAFVRYTTELRRSSPTTVRSFNFDDYLKNDPAPMARLILAKSNQEPRARSPEREPVADPPTLRPSDPPAAGRELLENASMIGPVVAARQIAGLPYGVALPAPWRSQVEPAQYHSAELTGPEDARVLRISGTKDTSISQWVSVPKNPADTEVGPPNMPNVHGGPASVRAASSQSADLLVARFSVRGHVSPGNAVTLIFTWLNGNQQYVTYSKMRLPDGEWPEFVTLEQAAVPPNGAAWAGIGLRVQNQVAGDWVEAKDFSLTARD